MKTIILFLFRLLSVPDQQGLTEYLVSTVYPGMSLYKSRPKGYKRPRDPYKVPGK